MIVYTIRFVLALQRRYVYLHDELLLDVLQRRQLVVEVFVVLLLLLQRLLELQQRVFLVQSLRLQARDLQQQRKSSIHSDT